MGEEGAGRVSPTPLEGEGCRCLVNQWNEKKKMHRTLRENRHTISEQTNMQHVCISRTYKHNPHTNAAQHMHMTHNIYVPTHVFNIGSCTHVCTPHADTSFTTQCITLSLLSGLLTPPLCLCSTKQYQPSLTGHPMALYLWVS